MEWVATTTESSAIKHGATGKTGVNEKKRKPHKTTGCATEKWLCSDDKKENENETGVRIAHIRQET